MVVMARVAGPFAVKGWIKVQPFTERADTLLGYPVWWLGKEGDWTSRVLVEGAVHGKVVIARLAGCEMREAAAALQGLEVAVPRSQLPQRREGEYYWSDLLGIVVRNLQGEVLGKVEQLLATAANAVLVVSGERERLIPFVAPFVVAVDLAKGEVVVDWGRDY